MLGQLLEFPDRVLSESEPLPRALHTPAGSYRQDRINAPVIVRRNPYLLELLSRILRCVG